ncbi:hypothetical protein P421_01020 [Heyndrickxia coagulans P38]|jgi:hypothetical protein|nr:hypothetical protein P421_01020 [Heyndrickxia coagulans P38]
MSNLYKTKNRDAPVFLHKKGTAHEAPSKASREFRGMDLDVLSFYPVLWKNKRFPAIFFVFTRKIKEKGRLQTEYLKSNVKTCYD